MRAWLSLLLVCVQGTAALAQSDSIRWSRSPWLEINVGAYSPSGLIGLGFGIPACRYLTGVIAFGWGSTEGKHYSAGLEGTAFSWRTNAIGPFAYWTWTSGRVNNDNGSPRYSTTVSSGEMVKAGVSYISSGTNVQFGLRGGYAWYVEPPLTQDASGAIGLARPDGQLQGGPLFSVSVRFPLGGGRR